MKRRHGLLVLGALAISVRLVLASPIDLKAPWMPGVEWKADGSYYGDSLHNGPDYFCVDFNWRREGGSAGDDLGYPILATSAGTVAFSAFSSGYGWNARLDHGSDVTSHYAHFDQEPFVVHGEGVEQGQVIGVCGKSGGDFTPHLHFGVFVDGQSVEPDPFDQQPMTEGASFQSSNSGMLDREFNSNGGVPAFGNDDENPGVHWYHPYEGERYRGGNVPNNCYVWNFNGGVYGACGIVYDGLGGARRAYTVHTRYWQNGQGTGWTQHEDPTQVGPTSPLGMPLTNVYGSFPSYPRQDFVGGWLVDVNGVVGFHTWNVCSPGWTVDGWNPRVSYRIAEIYESNGGVFFYGQPKAPAAEDGDVWVQQFGNEPIIVKKAVEPATAAGQTYENTSDAVRMRIRDGGSWVDFKVASSDGSAASSDGYTWLALTWVPDHWFLADVHNDGLFDLVLVRGTDVLVAESLGNRFASPPAIWMSDWGQPSGVHGYLPWMYYGDSRWDLIHYKAVSSSKVQWEGLEAKAADAYQDLGVLVSNFGNSTDEWFEVGSFHGQRRQDLMFARRESSGSQLKFRLCKQGQHGRLRKPGVGAPRLWVRLVQPARGGHRRRRL